MYVSGIYVIILGCMNIVVAPARTCGCKTTSNCYTNMLQTLLSENEEPCIQNSAISPTSITIFMNALVRFCGDFMKIYKNSKSYEGRNLYEVVIDYPANATVKNSKPVIVLEAGQQGGTDSVALPLYVIEQLIACEENLKEMISKVRWVILPCSNPDGLELSKQHVMPWKKNMRPTDTGGSYGVDISRNFDESWNACPQDKNGYSSEYPGKMPHSENETIFVSEVLRKYKNNLKAYISIRRDGHALLYPFASDNRNSTAVDRLKTKANEIVSRINLRAGFIQGFISDSIFNMNRKPHCGHSVDYAFKRNENAYTYELRVFLETDQYIMAKFQALPRGYRKTLLRGYFNVIREIYKIVLDESKLDNKNKR